MSKPKKNEIDISVPGKINPASANVVVIKNQDWSTVSRHNAPPWTRENEHVVDSYRPQLSWPIAFTSIFRLHSETLNIWSHLLATLFFVGQFHSTSIVVLKFYCVGAIVCFGFSTIFHIVLCVSGKMFVRLATLDYIGILVQLTTTILSWLCIVYGKSKMGQIYSAVEVILFVIVANYVLTNDSFHSIERRLWRSTIFVLYVIPSIIPMSDIYFGNIICSTCIDAYIILRVASTLVEVVCYACGIPKKYGIFNEYTSIVYSHGIFHALVWIGSICIFMNFKKLYKEMNVLI